MSGDTKQHKRHWTCPICNEVHVFPKAGPFNECCLIESLSNCAFETAANITMDQGDQLLDKR